MSTYLVTLTEIRTKHRYVEAESREDAENEIETLYANNKIVLTDDNVEDWQVNAKEVY